MENQVCTSVKNDKFIARGALLTYRSITGTTRIFISDKQRESGMDTKMNQMDVDKAIVLSDLYTGNNALKNQTPIH